MYLSTLCTYSLFPGEILNYFIYKKKKNPVSNNVTH